MLITLTAELARAAALDAGNRSMKAGNRTEWDEDDFNAASRAFDRLWTQQTRASPSPTKT